MASASHFGTAQHSTAHYMHVAVVIARCTSFSPPLPFLHPHPCRTRPQPLCSGADVWHRWPGGRWDADEQYEGQIGFEWDRSALHRSLTKIISQPVENNRRLPRLKVSYVSVGGENTGGQLVRAMSHFQVCPCLINQCGGWETGPGTCLFESAPCPPLTSPPHSPPAGAAVWSG